MFEPCELRGFTTWLCTCAMIRDTRMRRSGLLVTRDRLLYVKHHLSISRQSLAGLNGGGTLGQPNEQELLFSNTSPTPQNIQVPKILTLRHNLYCTTWRPGAITTHHSPQRFPNIRGMVFKVRKVLTLVHRQFGNIGLINVPETFIFWPHNYNLVIKLLCELDGLLERAKWRFEVVS